MPKVEDYGFGYMVVGGKRYERDLIVSRDRVYPNWWRREGHEVCLDDIKDVLEREKPEVLVVGTGYYGIVKVLDDLRSYLKERGIELIEAKTGEAWRKFNELLDKGVRVLGAFHLTC